MGDKPVIIPELLRVFRILNERLFDGKIQEVPVVIQVKKKVSIRYLHDIESLVIGADFTKLECDDIPGVLLHEMIHIFNHQQGTTDVTTNQYHNNSFLKVAINVGLVVIKHKTQGWAITSTVIPRNVVEKDFIVKPNKDAGTKLQQTFEEIKLDKAVFKKGRTEVKQKIEAEKPAKTYFLKYVCNCPPPHNSIRSGRRPDGPNALNILCMNCRSKFECVTELDEKSTPAPDQ